MHHGVLVRWVASACNGVHSKVFKVSFDLLDEAIEVSPFAAGFVVATQPSLALDTGCCSLGIIASSLKRIDAGCISVFKSIPEGIGFSTSPGNMMLGASSARVSHSSHFGNWDGD